jgi:hypothetical protein
VVVGLPNKLLVCRTLGAVEVEPKRLFVGGVGAGVEPKVMPELGGCPEV